MTRAWRVAVRGFDFDAVFVRARTRSQARMLVALAFKDAGWGSVLDGLRHATSVRLAPEAEDMSLVPSDKHAGVGLLSTEAP